MKIALSGRGRMGEAVRRVAVERGHEIGIEFDTRRLPSPNDLEGIDVLIDFSHASALDGVVSAGCASRTPLVIGTTGWNDRIDEIRSRCEEAGIAVAHAPNFSPGANVLFVLARRAAELIARVGGYEGGIEERHHGRKKDAPSGTALRIAREVRDGSGGGIDPSVVASRVGAEFGLHTLFFDSADDLIELSHRARGREGFARGAVIAAELVRERSGFFRFEELLTLQ